MLELFVRWRVWLALAVILAFGIFVRIYPSAAMAGVGFDENLYRTYTTGLVKLGLGVYPELCEKYVIDQTADSMAKLPPTRVSYILCGYLTTKLTGLEPLVALHKVSCTFSILLLFLSSAAAWRFGGAAFMLGVSAMMACAPTQIHMAQHALIDGVFAFWAVAAFWTLWECLRKPASTAWQIAHAAAIAGMVITKENAFFACIGLLGLMIANRWLAFGKVTFQLLAMQTIGGLTGVALLVLAAGGVNELVQVYRIFITRVSVLPYAMLTGDGPWFRYLVDLMLVSPVPLLLAIGAAFNLKRPDKALWFALLFVFLTYVPMCNVRYGMNLRYANMWDLPIRMLAFHQLQLFSFRIARYQTPITIVSVLALCALELHQYVVLFVKSPLYELVTAGLLQALKILK